MKQVRLIETFEDLRVAFVNELKERGCALDFNHEKHEFELQGDSEGYVLAESFRRENPEGLLKKLCDEADITNRLMGQND